jgi:hypothetical protein
MAMIQLVFKPQNIFLWVEGKRDGSLPNVHQGCARLPGAIPIGRGLALLPRTPKNRAMALADPGIRGMLVKTAFQKRPRVR